MSIGGSRVMNCRNYGVLGGRNEESLTQNGEQDVD
jgi:hypothetical protein